ncbi:MAG: peptidoglycan bridge formation protein FemAB [Desulfatitalea sp. BRH_c12]|nr:MAG: peptidoglycan bridge formation protein FemAB [Desulfatitalea sp. BRH_c12]
MQKIVHKESVVNLRLTPKNLRRLDPTDILFQTEYWGEVKTRLGWKPYAFDIGSSLSGGDVLVLIKSLGGNFSAAYVPQGPEFVPHEENQGTFLEALSEEMAEQLESTLAFIRYDLPWESPYARELREKQWHDYPESRIREMRMNFGTKNWNLRKAPVDMTVTHSSIVDIRDSEEQILARMKPKTRYNIKLARQKGIRVCVATVDALPVFYRLYRETALRNGFFMGEYRNFLALFSAGAQSRSGSEIVLLLATHNREVLAGAIIAISEKGAIFLHGASSSKHRNLMGPYALHWEAIRYARSRRCRTYDMGAVSPSKDPRHRFFGLYRFKTGFGGEILHRSGSWDYPLNKTVYTRFRNAETLSEDL